MTQGLSWMSILVAAIAAWVFGAIWYGALGKVWVAAQGETMNSLKAKNAGKSTAAKALPFILSLVAEVIIAWVLCGMLIHMGMANARDGAISGAFVWFGFVLTTIVVNNAYTFRSARLTAIDAAHWLGVLLIVGAIVGGWPH
jgi:hypothetical protein